MKLRVKILQGEEFPIEVRLYTENVVSSNKIAFTLSFSPPPSSHRWRLTP